MSAPLPPYPPPQDAWRFAPPPVSTRWKWVAAAGSVTALLAVVAMITTLTIVSSRDLPAVIDDPDIQGAIDDGCAELREIAVVGDFDEQTQVMQEVVEDWNRIDPDARASDEPFDDWVADWQRLIDARSQEGGFTEPEVDGEPISTRMDIVVTGCAVPAGLLED